MALIHGGIMSVSNNRGLPASVGSSTPPAASAKGEDAPKPAKTRDEYLKDAIDTHSKIEMAEKAMSAENATDASKTENLQTIFNSTTYLATILTKMENPPASTQDLVKEARGKFPPTSPAMPLGPRPPLPSNSNIPPPFSAPSSPSKPKAAVPPTIARAKSTVNISPIPTAKKPPSSLKRAATTSNLSKLTPAPPQSAAATKQTASAAKSTSATPIPKETALYAIAKLKAGGLSEDENTKKNIDLVSRYILTNPDPDPDVIKELSNLALDESTRKILIKILIASPEGTKTENLNNTKLAIMLLQNLKELNPPKLKDIGLALVKELVTAKMPEEPPGIPFRGNGIVPSMITAFQNILIIDSCGSVIADKISHTIDGEISIGRDSGDLTKQQQKLTDTFETLLNFFEELTSNPDLFPQEIRQLATHLTEEYEKALPQKKEEKPQTWPFASQFFSLRFIGTLLSGTIEPKIPNLELSSKQRKVGAWLGTLTQAVTNEKTTRTGNLTDFFVEKMANYRKEPDKLENAQMKRMMNAKDAMFSNISRPSTGIFMLE